MNDDGPRRADILAGGAAILKIGAGDILEFSPIPRYTGLFGLNGHPGH
jgi:hypothetical protein